jgi:hypothetical protein
MLSTIFSLSLSLPVTIFILTVIISAGSGKSEVPVYYLKVKQGYTIRKRWKKIYGYRLLYTYIDKCRYETEEQKKFRYGIPAYFGL